MADNTIMTAKNSFSEGLLMDFSPDNTQANCMTSALNATLLTFNGNEMSLLNDMGNGRVETAYLPEGYIPVGTCEFGDIVYIVSYNPLIDKAQVGCFPSPERNISSEELGIPNVSLSSSEFLEISGGVPTGNLVASSVKKVLFENDLHPGDKFIIASDTLHNNQKHISAYGNTDYNIDDFPKFVKIHVVSIEDSGKINYLDSAVRWYDKKSENTNLPYFISSEMTDTSGGNKPIDIDLYRNLLSSGYAVFNSKTSGLLALLIELEKITGFSCTWECFKQNTNQTGNILNTKYNVFFNFSWTTNNNDINPSHVVVEGKWPSSTIPYNYWTSTTSNNSTKLELKGEGNATLSNTNEDIILSRHYLPEDDISYEAYKSTYKFESYIENNDLLKTSDKIIRQMSYNNTRKLTYPKENCYILDSIKTKLVDGSIIYYDKDDQTINPQSSNGILKDSIINNKYKYPITKNIGSFSIPTHTEITYSQNIDGTPTDITALKENDISKFVYNYKVTPAMPYGKLTEFAQEGFIDFSKLDKENINITTWKYYNQEGTSTLTWGMDAYTEVNQTITNVKFSFYDNEGLAACMEHANYNSYNGIFTEYIVLNTPYGGGNLLVGDNREDSSATLQSDSLYLVKIDVLKSTKLSNDEYSDAGVVTFYRWFWTNRVFNSMYQYTSDYDDLKITLELNSNILFSQTNDWLCISDEIKKEATSVNETNAYAGLSANIQKVGFDDEENVKGILNISLADDYGVFSLNSNNTYDVTIHEGDESIVNVPESLPTEFSEKTMTDFPYIKPINVLNTNGSEMNTPTVELNTAEGYKSYKNSAMLTFPGEGIRQYGTTNLKYQNLNGLLKEFTRTHYANYNNKLNNFEFTLNFKAIHYSKYYYYTTTSSTNKYVVKSFLYDLSDLDKYNLKLYQGSNSKRIYFNEFLHGDIVRTNEHLGSNDDHVKPQGGIFKLKDDGQFNNGVPYEINSSSFATSLGSDTENWSYTIDDVWKNRIKTKMTKTNAFILPFAFGFNGNVNYYPAKIWQAKSYGAIENTVNNGEETLKVSSSYLNSSLKLDKPFTIALKSKDDNVLFLQTWKNDLNGGTKKNIDVYTSILTLLYYRSALTLLDESVYKGNYAYLPENYTLYSRDIVVDVKSNNSQVSFKNTNLSDYVDDSISKIPTKDISKISMFNVSVNLLNLIKAFPVLFKIDYIKPVFESFEPGNGYIVKSIYSTVPNNITQELSPEIPYMYDSTNRCFVALSNLTKIPFVPGTITVDDTGVLKCTTSPTGNIYINDLGNYFAVDEGQLILKSVPNPTKGNYSLAATNIYKSKGEWEAYGYLSNFKQTDYLKVTS